MNQKLALLAQNKGSLEDYGQAQKRPSALLIKEERGGFAAEGGGGGRCLKGVLSMLERGPFDA